MSKLGDVSKMILSLALVGATILVVLGNFPVHAFAQTGTSGDDKIKTGDGDVRLEAGAGDDKVKTGEGFDFVDGGSGDDKINTGGGDDEIYALEGQDKVKCGKGNDDVYPSSEENVKIHKDCEDIR